MKSGSLYRHGRRLVHDARVADTWWSRMRGLLLRRPLAEDGSEALLLSPCAAIHTIGMAYAIDIVFLASTGEVLAIHENVVPWRTRSQNGAHSTLEFHAGAIRRLAIASGDRLVWR